MKNMKYGSLIIEMILMLQFLPVHVPNEDEVKDARLFAENVRRRMAM